MNYRCALHSDVGLKSKTNQDSMYLCEAETDCGRFLLAAVCDGMGGLAKGEAASATVITELSEWFTLKFPVLLYEKGQAPSVQELSDLIESNVKELLKRVNDNIYAYGSKHHFMLGTTAAILILHEGNYFIFNVGDSRVYSVKHTLVQLTKDHSLVQQKIEQGLIRPEDAEKDPQRNVLLQCIGAVDSVNVDYYKGVFDTDTVFFLCSDGFRHVLTKDELFHHFNPARIKNEKELRNTAISLTNLNKTRRELDSISVIAIHATGEKNAATR